jgi:hypothetical protein
MPCSYEIDLAHDLVRTHFSGVLTLVDVEANRQRMIKDPAFRPDLWQLIDLRAVTTLALTAAEIRDLTTTSDFAPASRRAMVLPANRSVVFGMVRMFQTYREVRSGREQVRMFDSLEEAMAWLAR